MSSNIRKTLLLFAFPIVLHLLAMTVVNNGNGILDLNQLENYANQVIPPYITKDNTPDNNPLTDAGATLGRVLFYDTELSSDRSISCASCHQQEQAFSDSEDISTGVDGLTTRHSMRLINLRFGEASHFFWDGRANSLEALMTMPIQDHVEMGFSGQNGQPGMDSLLNRLEGIAYYQELFEFVYGDLQITEERLQKSMAQFLRSIQSFDTKYDEGRIAVANDSIDFANFSESENRGKQVFLALPVFDDFGNRVAGGAGCAACHRPPEFDIDPDTGNNGEIRVFGEPSETDTSIRRAPTLRDLFDDGLNAFGGFMHNSSMGEVAKIYGIIGHYNQIPAIDENPNIDPRLAPNGHPQQLQLTALEIIGLADFLKTLRGQQVYMELKWSNPFSENGSLTVIPSLTSFSKTTMDKAILVYPNPVHEYLQIQSEYPFSVAQLYNNQGQLQTTQQLNQDQHLNLSHLPSGLYILRLYDQQKRPIYSQKIFKQ